jgi:hypothetical protein
VPRRRPGERVDVVAHAARAVAVGGIAEHRTAVRIAGSCKTPRWAAPAAGYLAGATCLTQTYSIDKAGPAQHVRGLQGSARTDSMGGDMGVTRAICT